MHPLPHFIGSVWFATLVALLTSLGVQVLLGAIPIAVYDWILGEPQRGPVVLIAGVTSFWRHDLLIRTVSFGLGALIGCLLSESHSWILIAGLVFTALAATAIASPPQPASALQLSLWVVSAPVAALVVGVLFRVWRGDA